MGGDFGRQRGGVITVVLVKFGADFRAEGKTGWDGKTDTGHFSKIRPLASQKILHVSPTFSVTIAKEIHKLLSHSASPLT
jgi:hypothetical protein